MLAGTAFAGGLNLLGGALQQSASASQVQQQEEFQREMSSTQWQRGVADEEAAGLNPLLVYGQDQAMPGAMYTPQNLIAGAVGSAEQAGQAMSQIGLQGSQSEQSGSQAVLNASLTDLTDHQRDVMITQIMKMDAERRGVDLSNQEKAILVKFYTKHPDILKTQAVLQGLFAPLAGSAKDASVALSIP